MKTVEFSETIEACDMKVGRFRQLIEIMKVCDRDFPRPILGPNFGPYSQIKNEVFFQI